ELPGPFEELVLRAVFVVLGLAASPRDGAAALAGGGVRDAGCLLLAHPLVAQGLVLLVVLDRRAWILPSRHDRLLSLVDAGRGTWRGPTRRGHDPVLLGGLVVAAARPARHARSARTATSHGSVENLTKP